MCEKTGGICGGAKNVDKREKVKLGGRTNEMSFIDEGWRGGGERRETSKHFDITAFQTDNAASACHYAHIHKHTCTHLNKFTAPTAGGQGIVELPALASRYVNWGWHWHYNPHMLI